MKRGEVYLGLVVETCCQCGIAFAMPKETQNVLRQQAEAASFYCPLGHKQHYPSGETEAEKLRREVQRMKQQEARLHDDISQFRRWAEEEQHRARAYKGQVTRLKKRAAAGVCPCCNRTFADLARHMKSKHPDMSTEPDNVVPLRNPA